MKNPRPRVLVADDHAMFAEALRGFLSISCEVVGSVENGQALMDAAGELDPDVVVADVTIALPNGLNASSQLKERYPSVNSYVCLANETPPWRLKHFEAAPPHFL